MESNGKRRIAMLILLAVLCCLAIDSVSCRSHHKSSHRSHRNLVKRDAADDDDGGDELALADGAYDGDFQNDDDGELDDEDTDSSEVEEPYTGPPPSIKSANRNVTLYQGETLLLPCETTNAENFVVMWSKGQDIIFQGEFKTTSSERVQQYNNKTLSVSNMGPGDDGIYTCTVAGANGPPPTVVYNVLFYRPANVTRVFPEGDARLVREGESLEIKCEISGVPRPKLTWSKKGQRLSKEELEFGDQYIYIKKVGKEHTGMYQCLASNGVGAPAHGAVDIKVLYAPQVHIRKGVVNTAEGVETELACTVHSEPRSTIQWIKDGQIIQNSNSRRIAIHSDEQRSTLRIVQVRPNDFGKYTCKAQNQYGEDSKSVRVVAQPGLAEFLRGTMDKDGVSPMLEWAIESNQPLQHVELKYRRIDEAQPERPPSEEDWIIVTPKFSKQEGGSKYVIQHVLKDLTPGKYEARIKSRNSHGWSDLSDGHIFDGDLETNEIREKQFLEAPLGEVKSSAGGKSSTLAIALGTLVMCVLVRIA